jgi:hypothetical protein
VGQLKALSPTDLAAFYSHPANRLTAEIQKELIEALNRMRAVNPMVSTPTRGCDDSGFCSDNHPSPHSSLPQRSGSLRLPVPG